MIKIGKQTENTKQVLKSPQEARLGGTDLQSQIHESLCQED